MNLLQISDDNWFLGKFLIVESVDLRSYTFVV